MRIDHFVHSDSILATHVQHGVPRRPPLPGLPRLEVHLKHFTWGFIKNAAICLDGEPHIRDRAHVRYTHTQLAHGGDIPAGSSNMLLEVFPGIWRLH